MKRKIKYRCWSNDYKKMIFIFNPIQGFNNCELPYISELGCLNFSIHQSFENGLNGGSDYNLIPMQFIGITDINKKEIFEGDIVHNISGSYMGIIEWRQDRAKYDFKYKAPGFSAPQWMGGIDKDYAAKELKVIGNIYEDMELAKKIISNE